MKTSILLFIGVALFACSDNNNVEKEKADIKSLLEKESQYAANAELENWASCWVNSDEASFIITDVQGNQNYNGFTNLEEVFKDAQPFKLNLNRSNYTFTIGSDMAFVSFDQTDNWGGGAETKKKETRTLKKVDGNWKILNASVVDVSSFEKPHSESFHVQATKLPTNPKTGLLHSSGLAGISIGYVDIPGPMDFTPLLKGLPHDMCNTPHWGYVIDGSMKVIYADGKEETFKAGEVFYMPAPHTGIIDKNVKFVDFSPHQEHAILMDQIAKNIATFQENN